VLIDDWVLTFSAWEVTRSNGSKVWSFVNDAAPAESNFC